MPSLIDPLKKKELSLKEKMGGSWTIVPAPNSPGPEEVTEEEIMESWFITFNHDQGKGSGLQRIPIKELRRIHLLLSVVAANEELSRTHFEEEVAGTFMNSLQLKENPGPSRKITGKLIPAPYDGEDWYEWRFNTGRGSKPCKVKKSEMQVFADTFLMLMNATFAWVEGDR